ncbi:MAG: YkgJ family cysteine cluster protein [Saprospiraceae bacterium]|nr:YkgJ family cysteine cluster protein [Saprospiraceae bacterium]
MEVIKNYKEWFEQVKIPDKEALDLNAKELSIKAEAAIDCLECAKCCLTTVTTFTDADVQRISAHMGMKPKAFVSKYLIRDYDGMLTTTSVPCTFLDLETKKCTIYEIRPEACASFPHTSRSRFFMRRKAHVENSKFCGITRYVLDGLMEEYS